jgi:disulfide bond formation protein DsbB
MNRSIELALPGGGLGRFMRDPGDLAFAIAAVAMLTLAGAWAFQLSGLTPCELCLRERLPFYAGLPLALATAAAARRCTPLVVRIGFGLLIAVFAASALLGAYHAGVEWKFWPGPSECSGSVAAPAKVGDFLEQLKHVTVVRCDAAALRILGLSLAGWNAVISIGLAALAALGVSRVRQHRTDRNPERRLPRRFAL